METEYPGPVVADNKPLHLLLVQREVTGLDVKVAIAREAKHVLTLGVPGHTVSIRLLKGRWRRRVEQTLE